MRAATDDVRGRMRAAAGRLSLPLKLGLRGSNGNVPGSGAGSSIDFQDHRPYVPGDDPRHIDWQAYARSGHYTMKLYREEVRPIADIVLDASPSMFLDEAKALRTLELAWFCLESALRSGGTARLYSLQGALAASHELPGGWDSLAAVPDSSAPPALERIPWRPGSLRILISDLLYPVLPGSFIPALLSSRGRAIIFAPNCRAESAPDWLGNTELLDCESDARRDLRIHADDLANYTSTYENHFAIWRQEARRHGIPLARVTAEEPFLQAMQAEALPDRAVELV